MSRVADAIRRDLDARFFGVMVRYMSAYFGFVDVNWKI